MSSLVTQVTDGALAVINIIGLLFNVLVFYISVYRMKLKGLDIKLTMMISVIDIVFALSFLILISVRWGMGIDVVDVDSLWCKISGTVIVDTALCSVNIVGLLALIRYLCIVKRYKLEQSLWVWITLSIILVSTILTFGVMGGENFKVMPSGSYCEPNTAIQDQLSAIIVFRRIFSYSNLVRLVISVSLIVFCYIQITLHYRKQLLAAANELTAQCLNPNKHESCLTPLPWNDYLLRRTKVTISMVLILGAYAINLIPELIAIGITAATEAPPPAYLDGISITLVAALVITNPIFVLLIHEATYFEFLILIGVKKRRLSAHPYAEQFTR